MVKVLGRYKVGKHFTLDITERTVRYQRDAAAIAELAQPVQQSPEPRRLGAPGGLTRVPEPIPAIAPCVSRSTSATPVAWARSSS